MFVVLVLLILVLLVLLVYFGKELFVKKSEIPARNGLQSKTTPNESAAPTISKMDKSDSSDLEDPQDPEVRETEQPIFKTRTVQNGKHEENSDENQLALDLDIQICDFKATNQELEDQETPQSSPISTSSCISSEILTDSCLMEEENEEEEVQPSPREEVLTEREAMLRPSSLPVNFSSDSSSPAPYFNFTRKTPDIEIPRLMLEEFEALDRSIEKRKVDIRDLLKRIESAKRRHRRFSEQIHRVQMEHNIRF